MRVNRHMGLLVLTFGVLALLVRPGLICQFTTAGRHLAPAKTWSQLHRLVKKRKDHPQVNTDVAAISSRQAAVSKLLRPLIWQSWNSCCWGRSSHRAQGASVRFLGLPLLRYRLTRCLLI